MKRISSKEFKEIYSKVPRACVELILLTKHGLVLTKRAIKPEIGRWHLPGGTIIMGETVEQAVKRVAKEELGIHVSIERLAGIIEYPNIKHYFSQPIGIAYIVRTKQKAFELDEQASEVGVFKKMPKDLMIKDQRIFLAKLGELKKLS